MSAAKGLACALVGAAQCPLSEELRQWHASGRTTPCRPALLGWGQEEIARAAKVSVATIRRMESPEGLLMGHVSTLLKIQAAFEQAKIQFINEEEMGGFGVRMAKN